MKFSAILQDENMEPNVKSYILINMIFIDRIHSIDDYQRALTALFSFYRLNKEERISKNLNNDIAYDFQEDWHLIYSAFIDQYHIDLYQKKMHWFEFKALFDALHKDTSFMKIVGYRTVDLLKIKDKDTKKEYAELKEYYSLNKIKQPQRSAVEREQELIIQAKKGGGANGS